MNAGVTPILAALRSPWECECAVSCRIAAAVAPYLDRGVWVVEGIDIVDLLGVWDHAPLVVLLGVAESGEVGQVCRMELLGEGPHRHDRPDQIIALAKALDQAPERAVLLTIGVGMHGTDCDSPHVVAALEPARLAVVAEFALLAMAS